MRTATIALVLLVAIMGMPLNTTANHEGGGCAPTSSAADVDAGAGVAVFVDEGLIPDSVSVWIYQESNGVEGYQRDDDIVHDNACGHGGDTVIF